MPAVSFQSVSKTYSTPRGPFHALNGVSLDIEEGEFFGLLGPNGAGKTTLISILAGLARATQGKVTVLGHDVQQDFAAARRKLGVVPQELVFDPFFNVREALRFQSGYFGVRHNDDWIDELLAHLGLADKAQANMRQLSGGMKRRVLVAQALVHKPPIIVLDEPTAGVDVELRQTLWQFIARLTLVGFVDGKDRQFAAAQTVDAVVRSDRQQPSGKRPFAVVALDVLIDAQEGLLRGIFRGFRLAQHAIAQVVDGRLIRFDYISEGFIAALLRLEHPGHFVVHARSLFFYQTIRTESGMVAGLGGEICQFFWQQTRLMYPKGVRNAKFCPETQTAETWSSVLTFCAPGLGGESGMAN